MWYFRKAGWLGETTEGPISDGDILALCRECKTLVRTTLVCHATYTKGQWAVAATIPAFLKQFDIGDREREEAKERVRLEAERVRKEKDAERLRIEAEHRAEHLRLEAERRARIKHLFFDTETTGKPRNRNSPVSRISNWPRLVQIAWLLTDDAGNELRSAEFIIKPNGFKIPRAASRIHGITTERANLEGIELVNVLSAFDADFVEATTTVGHNLSFDACVLGAELLRLGRRNYLTERRQICTMYSSTNYCQLPGHYDGFKWPTLDELHLKLFGRSLENAHRAMIDARACAACFFELRRLGVIVV